MKIPVSISVVTKLIIMESLVRGKCKIHSDRPIEGVCLEEGCPTGLMCFQCINSHDSSHIPYFKSLIDIYEINMNDGGKFFKEYLAEKAEYISRIEKIKEDMKKQHSSAEAHIRSAYDTIKKAIEKKFLEILSELNTVFSLEEMDLDKGIQGKREILSLLQVIQNYKFDHVPITSNLEEVLLLMRSRANHEQIIANFNQSRQKYDLSLSNLAVFKSASLIEIQNFELAKLQNNYSSLDLGKRKLSKEITDQFQLLNDIIVRLRRVGFWISDTALQDLNMVIKRPQDDCSLLEKLEFMPNFYKILCGEVDKICRCFESRIPPSETGPEYFFITERFYLNKEIAELKKTIAANLKAISCLETQLKDKDLEITKFSKELLSLKTQLSTSITARSLDTKSQNIIPKCLELLQTAMNEYPKLNQDCNQWSFGNNAIHYCKGKDNGCGCSGRVYGSHFYTPDSDLCAAALFGGKTSTKGGFFMELTCPGRKSYNSFTANGIKTLKSGPRDESIVLGSILTF